MKSFSNLSRVLSFSLCGLLLASLTGCGTSRGDYTPSDNVAHQALETSLKTWQEGKPASSLEGREPSILPVDTQWQSGEKLESYEILREDPSDETVKKFVVNLVTKKASAKTSDKKETHYIVVGRGPIWVYEQEDYQRTLNMDNNPQPAAGGSKGWRKGRAK